MRQPIIGMLDGLQSSALTGGDTTRAVAIEAAKLGAIGVLIRSVGTSNDRVAHTGGMRYDPAVQKVPALALSNPDADLLERQLASGAAVRVRMRNTSSWHDSTWSANVIGELPGATAPRELVVMD